MTNRAFGLCSVLILSSAALAACTDSQEDPDGHPHDSIEGTSDYSDTTSFISSVSEIAWEWEAEEPLMVRELLPSAYGLLVVHGSGALTGLHGESGTELWAHEAKSRDSTVAVTPSGLRAVVVDRSDENEAGELLLVDTGTGAELDASPAPESATSHPDLVTENHILIPADGEVTAYDLRSGEHSWTYSPESHCLGTPDFPLGEDWRWPATTVEGSVLLPVLCSDNGSQAPEPQDEDVTMHLLALDEQDGAELWRSEVVPTTLGDDPMEHLYKYSVLPSEDGSLLTQRVGEGFRLLNASTGEQVEARWPEEGTGGIAQTNRVSVTVDDVVWYEERESEDQEHRYVKHAHSGEILDEISIAPRRHESADSSYWYPDNRVAALDDGMLTYGCGDQCPPSGIPGKPLTVTFTPWGEGDSVTLELDRLDVHQGSENKWTRFLPVPGAVVGYQELPGEGGGPIGTLVGLS